MGQQPPFHFSCSYPVNRLHLLVQKCRIILLVDSSFGRVMIVIHEVNFHFLLLHLATLTVKFGIVPVAFQGFKPLAICMPTGQLKYDRWRLVLHLSY